MPGKTTIMENGQISHVGDETFNAIVRKSRLPVLVDFWAPASAPCQAMVPTLEALAIELKGKCNVVQVNVQEARKTASSLAIDGVPTLVLFDAGRPVDRQVGVPSKAALCKMIEQAFIEIDCRRLEASLVATD
jgi:thioredoxin